ncbi:MAG: Ig-like domain-containing protein [Bacteroidales bacterium]|nr:Ig-like domain-containing protein [Bacteroidales bacterium]
MKKLYTFAKITLLTLFLCLGILGFGQNIANYTFSSSTTGSLTDMSSGTTQLVAPNQDMFGSTVTNIGFNFTFMGVTYTQFSANADGQFRFGSTAIGSSAITSPILNAPLLVPIGGDNKTAAVTGKVHYRLDGTAPNQILTVEWKDIIINYGGTGTTAYNTFQVRLYETNGVIEFAYGRMINNSTSTQNITFFIASSNTTGTVGAITTVAATPTFVNNGTTAPSTSFTASTDLTNLNSLADGSRTVFTFTPPVKPADATNLLFSNIKASSMDLSWTDNSTTEISYLIMRSIDGTNYTAIATLPANSTSYNASGLSAGTLYYWKIYAANEGQISNPLSASQSTNAASPINADLTVGPTGTFQSLTAAFGEINANTLSGDIKIILKSGYSSTSETFPIIAPSSAATGIYKITLYPEVSGLSVTSSNTTGTLKFDGAKNITIDGRVNQAGAVDLTIANTSATGYVIQLINDASYNTLKYVDFKGESTLTSGGVIVFSTTTGTSGNDYNSIDNCYIHGNGTTANLPTNCVYATGTSGKENDHNTISNCRIYDFFNAASTSAGINVSSGNSIWTVNNNLIYQTNTRTYTTGAIHYGIALMNASAGVGFTVTNNKIGYSKEDQTGTYTMTGSSSRLTPIQVSATWFAIGDECSIQGNTISNISLTTTSGGSANTGVFTGIYITGSGVFNVGDVVPNLVGSTTATDAIIAIGSTAPSTATTPFVNGFATLGSGTFNIKNNIIGGLSAESTSNTIKWLGVRAILINSGASITTVDGNTIGGNLVNSLRSGKTTSTASQIAIGIEYLGTYQVTISNNTISNLICNGVASSAQSGQTLGIKANAGSGADFTIINKNTIKNLYQKDGNVGTTVSASIVGIIQQSTNGSSTISENQIFNLENVHATSGVIVAGIYNLSGSTSIINERNLIYNLVVANNSATIYGIYMGGSGSTASITKNNIIRLGYKSDGSSITVGCNIAGICDYIGTHNYYFNSVYIGGSGVASSSATYALYDNMATNIRDYKNNILFNARSNASGSAINYAIALATGGTANSNYNILLANGTGGNVGKWGSTVCADFATWKTTSSKDANSVNLDPKFVDPTNVTPDLHLQGGSPADITGIDIPSITNDFFGDLRVNLTPTDIGADAGNFDNVIPTVNISPLDGATNVNVGDNIIFTFSEKVRKTDNSAIDASVISFINVTDGNTSVPFTAVYDDVTMKLTVKLTPDGTAMLGFKNYKVSIAGVEDFNDNALAQTYTSFTTGTDDFTAPTFSSANVENAAPKDVIVTFSENIKLDNATGFTVKVDGATATINSYSLTNNILTLSLADAITSHQVVIIEYAGGSVKDISDNPLAAFTVQTVTNNTKSSAKDFLTFSINKADNSTLASDIIGVISTNNIDMYVPIGTDITALIATFTASTYVQKVEVGTTVQISGTTANSYIASLIFKITAEDNTTKNYIVKIHPIHSVPYSQGFEGAFPPTDWMITNEGAGNNWIQSGTFHSGAKSMYYTYSSNAANAWAYTPVLTLVAGKKYVIEFWEKVSVQNEKMKLTAGLYPNVVAQTTEIWRDENLSNYSGFAKVKSTFTAPTSDNYHFGFNCFSDANKSNLYVDDISIREIGNNAQLSTLKIDGTMVAGFTSGTYTYNIELPYGTTAIPQITESNLSDDNATKVVTQATSLVETAKVEVTAEDGVSEQTYSITFTVAAPTTYAVNFSIVGSNGTLTATVDAASINSGDLIINGKDVVFAASPAIGYRVKEWRKNNTLVTGNTTTSYTISGIASAANVTVEFEAIPPTTYTVNFSVIGANGSLSATVDANSIVSGNQVAEGKNVIFTATPSNGYRIKEWKSNSTVVSGNTSNTYTITNITSAITVTVEFEAIPPTTFTINFGVVGSNGTLVATVDANAITSGAQVIQGKNVVFTATPANGYRVKEWKNNSVEVNGNKSNTYTVSNIANSITITVEFEVIPPTTFTINFNVIGANGTMTAAVDDITISTGAQVIQGKNVVFTAVPANGYKVKEWKNNTVVVNGNKTNTFTLSNITATATVTVEYEIATGIDHNELVEIELYPNPFKSFINIKNSTEISRVEISNIIGQTLDVIYLNSNEGIIRTERLRKGIYIIRIIDINGKILTRKLIRE